MDALFITPPEPTSPADFAAARTQMAFTLGFHIILAGRFRWYALGTGVAVGVLALPGAVVLGVRSPLIALSAVAGLVSLALLWRRA